MSRTAPPRLAILGAGPVGLEAALHAATLKLPFDVFERGQPAEHVRRWGHVRLFSPFGMNVTPLGLGALRSEQPRRALPGETDYIPGRESVSAYADKTTLVVGAGHSAATTVCLLASLAAQAPATWVVWLARGAGSQPLKRYVNDPLRERDLLCGRANMLATRGDGAVEFHPQTIVERIECAGADKGLKVQGRCGGEVRTWEVDRVIAN